VVNAALDIPDPAIEIYGRSRSGTRTYVVRRGETLGGIAKKHGTTVSALMRLNGLKKAVIHPGQQLVVRGTARRSTVAKSGSGAKSSKAAATKPRTSGKSSSATKSGAKLGPTRVAKR
jgi:LysM repeat protein